MRILIYSDVHGNLPAFEKMLKAAGKCEQYICLGDLVNYGPWSNECVDLALSLPYSTLIMGNHEEAFIQKSYPGTNPLVQNFFNQTFPAFLRFSAIENFIQEYKMDKFICTHTFQNKYIYPDTDIQLDADYIIGHSHHQFCYENNGHTLFNAGSVGQNRKYINVANYLIYDVDTKHINMQQNVFDLNLVISKMISLNYPKDCIDYYQQKKLYSND